jgi:hypothetical protein
MKLRGHDFDDASTMYTIHNEIVSIAGHATLLSEFTPVRCKERYAVEDFLKILYDFGICCHVPGCFPAYGADSSIFF